VEKSSQPARRTKALRQAGKSSPKNGSLTCLNALAKGGLLPVCYALKPRRPPFRHALFFGPLYYLPSKKRDESGELEFHILLI
jgi:hypothetical protein